MRKAQHSTHVAEPVVEPIVQPVVDLDALRSAFAAAVEARTAAAAAKQAALKAFTVQRDATTGQAFKAADTALTAAEGDARLLGEALADAEADQVEVDRLARLTATADLRRGAAEAARALVYPAKRVDDAVDALRQAMDDLRRVAGGAHDLVAEAIDGLGLGEQHVIDLRVLLLPRAAARGPAAVAGIAAIVKAVTTSTDADLSQYVEVNPSARTGGTLARAMLADAALVEARLGVKLPPLPTKTKKDASQ